jgi:hypothetical protein
MAVSPISGVPSLIWTSPTPLLRSPKTSGGSTFVAKWSANTGRKQEENRCLPGERCKKLQHRRNLRQNNSPYIRPKGIFVCWPNSGESARFCYTWVIPFTFFVDNNIGLSYDFFYQPSAKAAERGVLPLPVSTCGNSSWPLPARTRVCLKREL